MKLSTVLISLIFLTSTLGVDAASAPLKYQTGKKWWCYTIKKSEKNGKTYKSYVDKKYCKKKK